MYPSAYGLTSGPNGLVLKRWRTTVEEIEMADSDSQAEKTGMALDRRTALKVGVAAGVGAVAFTGPAVGTFGAAPAYAGVCSPGELISSSFDNNTNSSCGDFLAYQSHDYPIAGVGTFEVPTTAGGVQPPNFICSDDSAHIKSPPIPAGTTCRVRLESQLGVPLVPPFLVTSGNIDPLPALDKTTFPANTRVVLTVECTTDPADCF